jgi:hypothetical protein
LKFKINNDINCTRYAVRGTRYEVRGTKH